jgi:hypothetical protein
MALPFPLVAPPGRNDSAGDPSVVRKAIGVNDGDMETFGKSDRDKVPFAVVVTGTFNHERGAFEDQRREGKIKLTFQIIGVTFLPVPSEIQTRNLQMYIQICQGGALSGLRESQFPFCHSRESGNPEVFVGSFSLRVGSRGDPTTLLPPLWGCDPCEGKVGMGGDPDWRSRTRWNLTVKTTFPCHFSVI